MLLTGNALVTNADPVQPEHFEETMNPQVNVSGATRNGVQIGASTKPSTPIRFHVRLPEKPTPGRVCIEVVTRDGRYQAFGRFRVDEMQQQQFMELAFPTEFSEQLANATPPYVGVLATMAETTCDAADGPYLPVALTIPGPAYELEILINSARNDAAIVVPTAHSGELSFPCEPIDESPAIAFDSVCRIRVTPDMQLASARIERDDFFNPLPPVDLPISF